MPNFNDIINRTGAEALIPTEQSSQIFQSITEESAVLRLARRLPNMSRQMLKIPVLNSLPYAYFVEGDAGLKQTTKVDWTNKNIVAEEIAVIVPVPDSVLADSEYDIWAQIRPLVAQAFGQVIDNAILHGTNKPASWPSAIVTDATAKGNVLAATDDNFADIMGVGGLISFVEEDGFMVNGYLGSMKSRAFLRGITDNNGQPLFRNGMTGGTAYTLDGQRIEFPRNGSMTADGPLLIAGDWNQLVYAIRQDMTMTRSNEAVITDATGKVIYNLYQQDMTALRFVMRLGWQLPNPPSAVGAANPYPFAVLNAGA